MIIAIGDRKLCQPLIVERRRRRGRAQSVALFLDGNTGDFNGHFEHHVLIGPDSIEVLKPVTSLLVWT
ncbi:unnamed protein product [Pleuronectes platessa]|uniref:Uncharacterized protein n=1 Tax=Pleuronectes platessa TaxID=8262 RepID=A0A9N7V304_PLEPL|nr:unnamed protein product [Pleuronectes platessa]